MSRRCAYGYLFETPIPPDAQVMRKYTHAPHPLVLRVEGPATGPDRPLGGLRVHVGLVGRAVAYFPNVLFALSALGKMGIGSARLPYALRSAVDLSTGLESPLGGRSAVVRPPESVRVPIALGSPGETPVRVRLETPVRLVADGKLVRQLDLARLVSASLRRLELLWRIHGDDAEQDWSLDSAALVALANCVDVLDDRTRWVESDRFSRRQGREHPMGGLVGEVSFGSGAAIFIPVLRLAGRVHIGKHTAFGHGHFIAATEEDPSVPAA